MCKTSYSTKSFACILSALVYRYLGTFDLSGRARFKPTMSMSLFASQSSFRARTTVLNNSHAQWYFSTHSHAYFVSKRSTLCNWSNMHMWMNEALPCDMIHARIHAWCEKLTAYTRAYRCLHVSMQACSSFSFFTFFSAISPTCIQESSFWASIRHPCALKTGGFQTCWGAVNKHVYRFVDWVRTCCVRFLPRLRAKT